MNKKIIIYALCSFTPCFGMEPSKPNDGDEKQITGPTRPAYQPRMSEVTPLLRTSDTDCDVACAICLANHIIGAKLELPCGHSFCERCINGWRAANPGATCPLCRKDIPSAVAAGLIAPFAVIPAALHAHGAEHFDEVPLHHNPPAHAVHHPQPIHHAPAVHTADDCHAIAQHPAPVIPYIPAAPVVHHHHIEPQHNHYQDPAGPCCFACWRNFSNCCNTCCERCDRCMNPCCDALQRTGVSLCENSCYCCCCSSSYDHVPDRVACCCCCCAEHPNQHFRPYPADNNAWVNHNNERCCGPLMRRFSAVIGGAASLVACFVITPWVI